MQNALGQRTWVIAEGHIPGGGHGDSPALQSHETACILNTSDTDAHVEITVYFTDREPVGPYRLTVPARRTRHQRFNDLTDPEPVPRDTDFATVLRSDVPVVVQHSRLDSRQAELALLSTMAWPAS
ncbi:sensory rhodopsin transducer [Lentzea sp. CC55]|uniref:sensory rhodopsin transducer n=1 Tax=Lentzea sp. CC55 TaxID=2884909 RepID=UPI0027E1D5D2|nr:sensory rhodopsin transducer [Lentzea sp. CC55]MCG8925011.1 sensory rhodopsin transducer [Lentzea sp. CC55]